MTTEMDKPRGNPTFNPATHLQVSPHNCGGIFGRGIVPHLTTMSCCLACWSTSNESFVTPSFLEFLGGNPPRTCQFTITRYLRRLSSVCIWLEHKYIYIFIITLYIYILAESFKILNPTKHHHHQQQHQVFHILQRLAMQLHLKPPRGTLATRLDPTGRSTCIPPYPPVVQPGNENHPLSIYIHL